jgi:hypothetical protein
MNITQERSLSTYEAVCLLLDNNSSKITGLANFMPLYLNFKSTVNDIKILQGKQRAVQNSNQSISKSDARANATLLTRKIINALNSYFDDINNIAYDAILSIKPSYFTQLADTNLISDLRTYHDLGMTVAVQLEGYGIPTGWLTDYKAAIDTYENIAPVPRVTKSEQATYTAQLRQFFVVAKEQLEKINKKIALLEFDDAVFYNQYLSIKKIIIAKGKTLAFKANIIDINNATLKRFTFTLIRQSDNKAYQYKTNNNNTLQRRNLTEGIYTLVLKALDIPAFTGRLVLDANTTCAIRVEADMATKTILRVVKADTGEEI